MKVMDDQGIDSDSKFGDSSESLRVLERSSIDLKISVPKTRFANLEIA
jgi:hypothetical protein